MEIVRQRFKLDWALKEWQQLAGLSGGDFTVHQQNGALLRVLVGDVTGHGADAAATVDAVRPMIERELADGINEETLRRWSRVVHQLFEDRFIAFTCLEINLVTGTVAVWNAGNPAVIIRREGGRGCEQIEADGMPLGLVDDDEWCAPSPQPVDLAPGDEIVCYTDGLTDTVGKRHRRHFGVDRVLSSLVGNRGQTPLKLLRETVAAFADRFAEQDDLTVLWIGDPKLRAA